MLIQHVALGSDFLRMFHYTSLTFEHRTKQTIPFWIQGISTLLWFYADPYFLTSLFNIWNNV